jgi:hypothetical protein
VSAWIWCEVVCKDCAQTGVGQFTASRVPREELSQKVKAKGWRVIDGDWKCLQCQKLDQGRRVQK